MTLNPSVKAFYETIISTISVKETITEAKEGGCIGGPFFYAADFAIAQKKASGNIFRDALLVFIGPVKRQN